MDKNKIYISIYFVLGFVLKERERERWRERRRAGVEEWSGPAGRSVCVSGAVRGCRRGNNHFQQPFVSVHFLSPSFISSSIPHFGLQPSFDRFLLFKFSSLFCVGFCFACCVALLCLLPVFSVCHACRSVSSGSRKCSAAYFRLRFSTSLHMPSNSCTSLPK